MNEPKIPKPGVPESILQMLSELPLETRRNDKGRSYMTTGQHFTSRTITLPDGSLATESAAVWRNVSDIRTPAKEAERATKKAEATAAVVAGLSDEQLAKLGLIRA